ncbi:MAG TPA: hypothetical protein VN766_14995 [Stellaceae bacterium]|jgi:hypothetical protein|nr:hypothetical protein [Stellaceae bacterium]
MANLGIGVLCVRCGLVSRRPIGFLRARRSFVCGGCKEIIPLDERSVLDREGVCVPQRRAIFQPERRRDLVR